MVTGQLRLPDRQRRRGRRLSANRAQGQGGGQGCSHDRAERGNFIGPAAKAPGGCLSTGLVAAALPRLSRASEAALTRLFVEQPEAADLFEMSAGYAVFDTRKLVLFGLAAGAGRGVAISRTDDKRIYMNMGTAGVGMSLGIGGFETQVVLLFQEEWDFNEFVTMGYDATAEAGTMFGEDKAEFGVRFVDGRAIFVLTKQGWKVSATAAGTKYWADQNLN